MRINDSKLEIEKSTVKQMIRLYCRRHHFGSSTFFSCDECNDLIEYAFLKLDKCVYGQKKPSCNKCTTHCYNQKMRKKIKAVMRYSGPRMIYINPILAIKYLVNKINFKFFKKMI
jgi:hypothetical protein